MLSAAFIAFSLHSSNAATWDYESDWAADYAECGALRQSPIDLPFEQSTCPNGDPLQLDWSSEDTHYVIRNSGYTLVATPFKITNAVDISNLQILHHTNDTSTRLQNAFYDTYDSKIHKEYCFDSLHFHWAQENDAGSEHTIDGTQYPLELHLVHYACDYLQASEAIGEYVSGNLDIDKHEDVDDDNVLAVIGIMFEIGAPNPVLDKMLDELIIDGIYENGDHDDGDTDEHGLLQLYYTHFDIADLLPESRDMVAYRGSLTTPPCLETVRWHVMKEFMTVSPTQLEQFRSLLHSSNTTVGPNYRPVQPLNDRKIFNCVSDITELTEDAHHYSKEGQAKALKLVFLVFGLLYLFILLIFLFCWFQARQS